MALAAVTVDAEPRFTDGLGFPQDGSPTAGSPDRPNLPVAIGARLQVSGDRQGTFDLNAERGRDDGTFGLEGDDGRIFFAADLSIEQMSYDGLDFFPDPGDCDVAPGEINEEIGVAAVEISCVEITDVRDTATVTFGGTAGLPRSLVASSDLPPLGGSFDFIGEERIPFLEVDGGGFFIEAEGFVSDPHPLYLFSFEDADTIAFTYDRQDDSLGLDHIVYESTENLVPPGVCEVATVNLGALSPTSTRIEVKVTCDPFPVVGLGEVGLQGSAVVDKVFMDPPS